MSPLPLLPPLELPVVAGSASARVCHFTAADRIMSIISLSVSHDAFVELPAALRRRRPSQNRNANTDGGGIRVAPTQWFRTLEK